MFTVRFFALKARPACSQPRKGRAIAVCIRSRLTRVSAVVRRRGVLGILPGLVGVIQATEAIKLILARVSR